MALDRAYNKNDNLLDARPEDDMKKSSATTSSRKKLADLRNRATLESARAAGLLGTGKNARVAGRVSSALVAAAKRSAGLSSDSDVIEVALAKLALEDDFGARLVRNKGSIPHELAIEL
jgi:hypothetical protein